MSIGFWTLRDEWVIEGEIVVRNVYEVKLFDVSPVTAAAYTQTDVGVRLDDLSELSMRMKAGKASPAELIRLQGMLDELNKRGSQVDSVKAASGGRATAMRLQMLKMLDDQRD